MAIAQGKCFKCKRYRMEDDLVLNRTNWEYECKDTEACEKALSDNSTYDSDRMRKKRWANNKAKGKRKKSVNSVSWNRMR